ncbi:MAG: hypothetical protein G01um101413_789 [Parcubacteria group bacterium Gr01-1014_13]|nr:MAG: hypothetical protein G01um101413_789 [Parcubacteria group bacterium Gr01-1014_13]
MSETSQFVPQEAMKPPSSRRKKSNSPKSGEEIASALAEAGKAIEAEKAKEEEKKSNKRKSKEMEADFEKRISDYKYKEIMTELRGKLKKREEERKLKEKAPDYESFEISSETDELVPAKFEDLEEHQLVSVKRSSGKIDSDWVIMNKNEADQKFLVMKKDGTNKTVSAEDIFLAKNQEKKFYKLEEKGKGKKEKKVTNKNVIRRKERATILEAEPVVFEETEEPKDDGYESYEVSEGVPKKQKNKLITSEESQVVSGEINNEHEAGKIESAPVEVGKNIEVLDRAAAAAKDEKTKRALEKTRATMERFDERTKKIQAERVRAEAEADRQQAKESRSDEARTDYVEAYKKYDPRFTKNKSDDQIAKTKPPFFAFGKAVRELKRLYSVMLRAEDSKVGGLSPEARQAIIDSARKEEEEFIESNKKFAPKK